ncbi:MAG: penicillin-binding transpeptidase domain-containing protein, partial [Myxococcaceae bacterium]
NGGVRMRPYLVQRVVDPDGVVLLENKPTELGQVVSEKTAKSVVSMLESVVEKDGTAPKAKMAEYRVAGKTGTAQKVDPVAGGYSEKRVASFVGMVPAEAPRAVIFVVIDEPKTDVYGGLVAAPAFKEIAEGLMPYWGVPTSVAQPVVAAVAADTGHLVSARASSSLSTRSVKGSLSGAFDSAQSERSVGEDTVTERVAEGSVSVPDLSGKVGREAVSQLLSVALEPRLSGSGRVVSQSPAAGAMVEKGSRVTVTLQARQ